jgi:hypothetical protein
MGFGFFLFRGGILSPLRMNPVLQRRILLGLKYNYLIARLYIHFELALHFFLSIGRIYSSLGLLS